MRAVVFTDEQSLVVQDIDLAPQDGEVVLRVDYCGICGSDLHMFQYPQSFGSRPGLVMGHEFAGEVVEIIGEAPGWEVGDRAVGLPMMSCGECDLCQAGESFLCRSGRGGIGLGPVPGAYAERVRTHPLTLFHVPDHLPQRHAALTEPLAVGIHGAVRAGIQPGESCVVMGGGPVGQFTMLAARLRGAGPVAVSDPAPGRREQAAALGADAVIDPTQDDPGAAMRELTGRDADVVFECVGAPTLVDEAVRLVRLHGRICVVGVSPEPVQWHVLGSFAKEPNIRLSAGYNRTDFEEALAALGAGKILADLLITDEIGLDEVPAMFEALAKPTTQVKVLVRPNA